MRLIFRRISDGSITTRCPAGQRYAVPAAAARGVFAGADGLPGPRCRAWQVHPTRSCPLPALCPVLHLAPPHAVTLELLTDGWSHKLCQCLAADSCLVADVSMSQPIPRTQYDRRQQWPVAWLLNCRFSDWRAPTEAAPVRQQSLSANQRAWQQGHSSIDSASATGGGSFGGLSSFAQPDNGRGINMGAYPQQGPQVMGRPQPVQVLQSPLVSPLLRP